ncbi:MAG: hypothetical protein AB1599_06040 [Planctomycetota bacterium]
MRTLLCVIAAIAFLALPVVAEDVKVDFKGSRMAVGYMDNGGGGDANPGTFGLPDAKFRINGQFDENTTAVLRMSFSNGVAGNVDYGYVKLANVVKNLAKSDTVNPDIYVGRIKINYGEETWTDNPIESSVVQNSRGIVNGYDMGIEFRQSELPINLPFALGYALAIMNGSDNSTTSGFADTNNTKAYLLKVMGTMKNMPLYFSLTQYDSGTLPGGTGDTSALMGRTDTTGPWYIKGYELNLRYDMLEGAQKFTPTKAPLFSDAKAVFRLAYGSVTDGDTTVANRTTIGHVMLDGIYNVDKKWYVAFRYGYDDQDVEGVTTGDIGKTTRMSFGGGHRLSDNAVVKLDYTTNTESNTASNPKVDNDSVSLLMTVKW